MDIKVIRERLIDVFNIPEAEREHVILNYPEIDYRLRDVINETAKLLAPDPTIIELKLQKLLDLPCITPITITERDERPHIVHNNMFVIGLEVKVGPWITGVKNMSFENAISTGVYEYANLYLNDYGQHLPFSYWKAETFHFKDVNDDINTWYNQMKNVFTTSRLIANIVLDYVPEEDDSVGAINLSLPDKLSDKQLSLNKLMQKIYPFQLNQYYLMSILFDLFYSGLYSNYYEAYVTGETDISSVKNKQAEILMKYKSEAKETKKKLDEIEYRNIYLSRFGTLPKVKGPILEAVSAEIKKYILKEVENNRLYIEEVINNKCPHVALYNKFRTGDTGNKYKYDKKKSAKQNKKDSTTEADLEAEESIDVTILDELKTYFGDIVGKNQLCNNCGFPIMCTHLLADSDQLKEFLIYLSENGWYYCNNCNEQIMESEESMQLDYGDKYMYFNKEDIVYALLWKLTFIGLKQLQFKTIRDDTFIKHIATAISKSLYYHAKDIVDGLAKYKMDTYELTEAKKRVYVSIYVFATIIKVLDKNKSVATFREKGNNLDSASNAFTRLYHNDMVLLNINEKQIHSYISKAFEKVTATTIETAKVDSELLKVLLDPVYNYIFTINSIDMVLHNKKAPKYENIEFLLHKKLENVLIGTFSNPREPKWEQSKIPNMTIDNIILYRDALYQEYMLVCYDHIIDIVNMPFGSPIVQLDISKYVVIYFINQLYNKSLTNDIPFINSMQFRRYDVTIEPRDFERENFFNYYFLRCPEKEFHEFDGDMCKYCKVTREQLHLRNIDYYKKYQGEYNIVIDNIKEKEDNIILSSINVVIKEVELKHINETKNNLPTLVDRFYEKYKASETKWTKEQFTNAFTFLGLAEFNRYSDVIAGTPREYDRKYILYNYLAQIVILSNMILNNLSTDEILPKIIELYKPKNMSIPIGVLSEKAILAIIIDYILEQDDEYGLYLITYILRKEKDISKPTLTDISEYKAHFETKSDLFMGDDKKDLEKPEKNDTFYDFDYVDSGSADADEHEVSFN